MDIASPKDKHSNRLATETSPYLLQHAHNPVEWMPWGEEALTLAREQNKPILLSIGYSACHWCHVMAHESFEDEATARVMNELFINIKVDREERPDLDRIYQAAHQFLTQRPGGWPLTMFLTPEQVPFFGGTYFPIEPRYGMPAFKDLMQRVAEVYRDKGEAVAEQCAALSSALENSVKQHSADAALLSTQPLAQAKQALSESYDSLHGGFGAAPKFPHPGNLAFLLRAGTGPEADPKALDMALTTLRKMAEGGLYDQLGGGFFRYSVDERWAIPHFEKMLYDNGPLLELYSQAWQITGDPFFKQVAEQTGEWVMREMQANHGGYYATLDADSEGVEGKFYVWTPEQLKALLPAEEYAVAEPVFRLNEEANFEGQWHLQYRSLGELADILGLDPANVEARFFSARNKLFMARSERTAPGRDEKVLSAWNGLMIKGMAVAGHILQRDDFIRSAERALNFIQGELFKEGRLLANYKDGRATLKAYLDDYANLIDAILSLLEVRWHQTYLDFAIQLADCLIEHFEDEERGGFFFTADDHESLIMRPKPFMDEAIPAGNAVAAYALNRLGLLLNDLNYTEAARRAVQAGWQPMFNYPTAHGRLLQALEEQLIPPQTLVLRGQIEELSDWQSSCQQQGFAAHRQVLAVPTDAPHLPEALASKTANDGITAYLCSGQQCSPPITSLEELTRRLVA